MKVELDKSEKARNDLHDTIAETTNKIKDEAKSSKDYYDMV